jgi:hypothetical protein
MAVLPGCVTVSRGGDGTRGEQTPLFRPPTQAAPPTTPAPQAGQKGPTATPTLPAGDCENNLVFLADQTIPDGTVVGPLSTLDKRWEVENGGTCNWDARYRVRLIAGPDLGAQAEQALYPARSGSGAVIRMVLKAPAEPGSYRSAWQAVNPQGEPFGDPFFIEIVVESP